MKKLLLESHHGHKKQSFAGSLQLIQSFLFSIQAFWCNVFILPKKAIKAIEQKLASFLWNGSVGPVKSAKVAWDVICFLKSEGGLALKRVEEWNKAAVMRFIWLLFTQAGSLWVAWIKMYCLKDQSFWSVRCYVCIVLWFYNGLISMARFMLPSQ